MPAPATVSRRTQDPRLSGYFSASELRTRGWTAALIQQFLPEPCRLEQNPHNPLSGQMRLFSNSRVHEIETYPEFQFARHKAQRQSMRQVARTRKQTSLLLAISNRIPLDIPSLDFDDLLVLAHEAYMQNQIEIKLMDDKIQANRLLAVEYLEQRCEPAIWELDDFYQAVGIREARAALKHRIYLSISLKYRELSEECARRDKLIDEM